jgi:hypothetical protein
MKTTKKQTFFRNLTILGFGVIPLASCGAGGNASSATSSAASSTPVSSETTSSSSSVAASSTKSASTFDGTDYYDHLADRVGLDSTNENNIDEEFASGTMSDDYWNTLSGVWQNDMASSYPHNGVQSRNLFYVTNGSKTQLAFKGRGIYSSDSDTATSGNYRKPEGACIISKKHLGPGRYEINMATMPREGGVTAMWTYCTTTGSEASSQNEIDIEVGGNTSETYMREWCTTWTKHTTKATVNVDVSSLCYLNDGKMHKYTFDWYTDYQGSGEKRVDWFLDGIFIASVTGEEVSETEMPLWIGLWFPNWCSTAAFDTDYLLVDSIKYTAFDSTQAYENCRAASGYTQVAPSKSNIQTLTYEEVHGVNKIANGSFTTLDVCPQDQTYYGWALDSASEGTLALVDDTVKAKKVLELTAGTGTDTNHGEYLTQTISNAYAGYTYTYSIDAKKMSSSASAQLEFHYSTIKGSTLSGTKTIALEGTDWQNYTGTITMPQKCGNLRMDLVVNDGSAAFTNASIVFNSAA